VNRNRSELHHPFSKIGAITLLVAVLTAWTNHATLGTVYSQTLGDASATSGMNDSSITPIERQTPTWLTLYRPAVKPGFQFGKYFYINIPKTMIALQYEFRDVTSKSNDSETTSLYHKFSETIGFSTDGWIYHPNLLTYDIGFEPEFVQATGENTYSYQGATTSTTDDDNTFSPDYLLRLTLLESKPYTAQFFANQRETTSWSIYSGGITSTLRDYGTNFELNYFNIPSVGNLYSNLSYTYMDYESSGFNNYEFSEDQFHFSLGQRGSRLKTMLDGFYSDHTQVSDYGFFPTDPNGSIETRTQRLELNHTHQYQFLENQRSTLYGYWNYSMNTFDNPSTTLEYEYLRLAENFIWKITGNLTSYLDLTYQNTQQSEDLESNNYASRIRLQHRLFENLTTETGAAVNYYDYSTGMEQYNVNPFLNFSYYRNFPWGGIALHTGWNYQMTERNYDESQLGTQSALNERHTLQYGQDTFLNNYNVIIESIIVTNTAGTIQYVRDIDYQVEQFNETVIIRPTLFGNINDGQAVVVNYSYRPDHEYSDDVFMQHYSASTTIFKSLHLSLSHSRANQNVTQGTHPTVQGNSTSTQGQVRYNISWSDTIFDAKHTDNDAIGASQQWHISQKFTYRLNSTIDLAVMGSYGETYYDDDALRDNNQYGGTLQANWRIMQGLTFRSEGYTTTTENSEETVTNTGLRVGFVYTYRLWSATLLYNVAYREFERQENNSSQLDNLLRLDIIRIKF